LLRTAGALALCPQFRASVHRTALEELRRFPRRSAERTWKTFTSGTPQFAGSHPDYVLGFSRPEDGGRWTEAYAAVLTLPVAAAVGTRVQVGLIVTPLLAVNKRRFAFEICGGEALVTRRVLRMGDRLPATIVVEADVIAASGFQGVVLAFNLPDAARPVELGAGGDSRLLGLLVQEVKVSAGLAQEAAPRVQDDAAIDVRISA
jgi:hypothetical protein